jgi:hypothetical protein
MKIICFLLSIICVLLFVPDSECVELDEQNDEYSEVNSVLFAEQESTNAYQYNQPLSAEDFDELTKSFPRLPVALNYIIKDLGLFGVYKEYYSNQTINPYISEKIIEFYKDTKIRYSNFFLVDEEMYSFHEMPFIKLYIFGRPPTPVAEDQAACVLFNEHDSTLYYFDGYSPSFSKVIKPCLKDVITENKLLDLITLYINTISIDNYRIILSDIATYKYIWNQALERQTIPELYDSLMILSEQDIKEITSDKYSIGTIINYVSTNNYYDIFLTTWEFRHGTIERWNFRISENVFDVKWRYPINIHKGPWLGLIK